jgi:oligopeptide/dipeptide ABC transporter ATP-binding protein
MTTIIEAQRFTLELPAAGHARPVLNAITLDVEAGSCLGIVGESGSGKSLFSRALLGAFPEGAELSGSLRIGDVEATSAAPERIRALRQSEVGMIYQDPRASINPVHRIEDFLIEGVVQAGVLSRAAARERAIALLRRMRFHDPEAIIRRYPDELSGGMLQRVMIAGALIAEPSVLLCDEATTALDVTTQAEIVSLLNELRVELGVTLIFVTHDLELAGELCDTLCVLYAGEVMELGPTAQVLTDPRHPYTAALLESTPRLTGDASRALPSIPGVVLPLSSAAPGCVFADRCRFSSAACTSGPIGLATVAVDRRSRCVLDGLPEGAR